MTVGADVSTQREALGDAGGDRERDGGRVALSPGGGDGRHPVTVASESAALLSMIERAARDPTVDIDRMERLFKMHEQAEARRARTSYLAAFAAMQAELPAAVRAGKGHNGKAYARYEDVIGTLRPHFEVHGFSISHRVDTSGDRIKVTGILGHKDGHSEETQFSAPPDSSGNKTPIHAMASTISYGKRYVTLTLTGIATEGEDDDARKASVATITDEQAEQIKEALEATNGLLPRFCAYWKLDKLTDLPADKFEGALRSITARKRNG